MADADEKLVGITPAMCEGSGMVEFANAFHNATMMSLLPSNTPSL